MSDFGADPALIPAGPSPSAGSWPTGFDPGYLEPLVHDLWQDARLLAVAPASKLVPDKAILIEAREALNDAIAKAEREEERRANRELFEEAA